MPATGLSFVVEGVTSSRPSRHPKSGMSSSARHSASSIAFRSRMGASTRGIALGSPHSSVRLHTSVWEESPPLRRSSADSSKQHLEGFCATTGTFLPPTERSDRGNTSVGNRTRVFQPLLPCSKEGRRPETHSGSAAPEPFPLQREVQDADDEDYHVSDSRRGLVCHYRPKGCIFSHPGRPATQEVPSVCLWREGLPIQGPSPRPGLGTENVHEVHGCCTGPLEVSGHSCSELLRRLSHSFLHSGVRMGAIHRRHMITTNASMTGWGVVFEGRPARGEWTGEFISWHINCLDLRAVFLALMHFLPVLGKHHIIVRTDNMVVVSHINRQGGSRSRTLDKLVRCLLLWSQGKFLSLRAVHVPRILIFAADFLSRQKAFPRSCPHRFALRWSHFTSSFCFE